MTHARGILAAVVLAMAPALAQAEGFYTRDLGEGGAPDACMSRAQRALNAFAMEPGNAGALVVSGAWSVAGYNLQPGNVDVEFACPYRDSFVSIVLMSAHSDGDENQRIFIADALEQRWNAAGQAGEVRDGGTPSK